MAFFDMHGLTKTHQNKVVRALVNADGQAMVMVSHTIETCSPFHRTLFLREGPLAFVNREAPLPARQLG